MVTALLGVGSFIVHAMTEKQAARATEALQRELDPRRGAGGARERAQHRCCAARQVPRRHPLTLALYRALFGVTNRSNHNFLTRTLTTTRRVRLQMAE
jgi:hypothetical protein